MVALFNTGCDQHITLNVWNRAVHQISIWVANALTLCTLKGKLPSNFRCLPWSRSQGQQSNQRCPDLPLCSYLHLFSVDTEAFLSDLTDISSACPGSALVPRAKTVRYASPMRRPGGIIVWCLNCLYFSLELGLKLEDFSPQLLVILLPTTPVQAVGDGLVD